MGAEILAFFIHEQYLMYKSTLLTKREIEANELIREFRIFFRDWGFKCKKQKFESTYLISLNVAINDENQNITNTFYHGHPEILEYVHLRELKRLSLKLLRDK